MTDSIDGAGSHASHAYSDSGAGASPSSPVVSDGNPPQAGWDGVRELHPAVLASRLTSGAAITVIDVREPWEWETARLAIARHIPLGEFARAAASLERGDEIVIYCHHGVRSRAAANHLAEQGFTRLWNLSGGIDRYSLEVDPAIPRY